jgi:hypothetical protein
VLIARDVRCAALSVPPDYGSLLVKSEFHRKSVNKLGELTLRDCLLGRKNPVTDSVFTTEPKRILARVLKIASIASDQGDGIVVLTIAEVPNSTLKGLPTCLDSLALDDHRMLAR